MGRDHRDATSQDFVVVVGKSDAQDLGERADDLPVLLGLTLDVGCLEGALHAALGVNVGGRLLGEGSGRKDDVGHGGTDVTVVALVDDKGVGISLSLDVVRVRAEEVQELGLGIGRLGNGCWAWYEANVLGSDASGGCVKNRDAVPLGGGGVGVGGLDAREHGRGGGSVDALEGGHADDDEGTLRGSELSSNGVRFVGNGLEDGVVVAEPLGLQGEISLGTDAVDGDVVLEVDLANAGVDDGGLHAGVRAYKEHKVGLVDALDGRVKEV